MQADTQKVYGAPGTGKTTYLIGKVIEELQQGTHIEDIAYVGFTRAACSEALHRAMKVVEFDDKRYWFMTVHATCLKMLMQENLYVDKKIADWQALKSFCQEAGLDPPSVNDDTVEGGQISTGSAFFSTKTFLVNTFKQPSEWMSCPHAQALKGVDYEDLLLQWNDYKAQNNLVDFDDMLLDAYLHKLNVPTRVLIVDEFQDISPLQLAVIQNFAEDKERIYVAGDDDQALYGFQGADPTLMLSYEASSNIVLGKSYRCKRSIWERAQRFIRQNVNRQDKVVDSVDDEGEVVVVRKPWDFEDLERYISDTTYILLRTNYLVGKMAWQLANRGILFRYLDSEKERLWGWNKTRVAAINYVTSGQYRLRLERLNELTIRHQWTSAQKDFIGRYCYLGKKVIPDDIHTFIGTIHSAKGREADSVLVFNDITARVADSMETLEGLEAERRVWYVAMTRARSRLVLVDRYFNKQPGGLAFSEVIENDVERSA